MAGRLAVEDLHVRFQTGTEPVHAVSGASFEIASGEIVGLVGESGCGKSVTARSIVRLEEPGEIVDGSIRFDGEELTTADDRTLQRLRGRELAMVFQDPSTTLNPVYSVGEQIAEALRIRRNPDHQPFFRELAAGIGSCLRASRTRSEVLELLETVGIPQPEERIDAYPHQLSGGLCQRVMLAIALARQPSVLIADEPTTALDTTTQAAILDRLGELSAEYGMGTLLISHDFGVVSTLCDRVVVMYDGVVVERGPTDEVRSNPSHPYTKALLGCLPHRSEPKSQLPTIGGTPPDGSAPSPGCAFADRCPVATNDCHERPQPLVSVGQNHVVRCGVSDARDAAIDSMRGESTTSASRSRLSTPAADGGTSTQSTASKPKAADGSLVDLESVTKSFRQSDALVDRLLRVDDRTVAVKDVSLAFRPGETVGLVGESGCGKSTLARLIAGLEEPTDGIVRLRGEAVGGVDARKQAQIAAIGVVFQNPGTSLNPKRTVGESIREPLLEAGWDRSRRAERVEELLGLVELSLEHASRYPRQLSGGQRQRVALARALALEPSIVVLDEPTAALDVSTQATVLNLLADLQAALGLTYLFISHDLDVIRHVADRVAVMDDGRLLETGPTSRVLSTPSHPSTQALLEATPGDRTTERSNPDSDSDTTSRSPNTR
ncbi:dipeptide ABC transporter ATP-binding protein [Natronorubrum thiooxidans]|uniref:Peptide/nickel transport system ATP-binding protein n=1 Tax=Natronorubrum thiooxidans TaxID=308853 RepID=A0A1N7CE34_9EURY|nr:ABC transporter ATP-binding protein [Natronorubrum thiooxidans]SIR61878.1 peptide/nickel transport system ATP-binding protein [Natronorubrum thiooxidans]